MNTAHGFTAHDLLCENFNSQFDACRSGIEPAAIEESITRVNAINSFIEYYLPQLELFAFFVLIAADNNLSVSQGAIDQIRETFITIEHKLINSPIFECMSLDAQKRINAVSDKLAIGGSILAINNDPQMKALFEDGDGNAF